MNKYLLPTRGQSPYTRFFALILVCVLYAASVNSVLAQTPPAPNLNFCTGSNELGSDNASGTFIIGGQSVTVTRTIAGATFGSTATAGSMACGLTQPSFPVDVVGFPANIGSVTLTFSQPVSNIQLGLYNANSGDIGTITTNAGNPTLTLFGSSCSNTNFSVSGNTITPTTSSGTNANTRINVGGVYFTQLTYTDNSTTGGTGIGLTYCFGNAASNSPAATPVATGTNPTTAGSSTGSVTLSASTGSYPANTPVSVTYNGPSGSTTFTGTTNGSGQIIIPNLPAGTYGPFTVSVNGGPASSPGGSATLVDPAPNCAANAGTITRQ